MAQTESHLEATLNYCAKDPLYDVEKPYQVVLDLHGIPGATNSNHKYEAVKQVPIFDVRTVTRAPLLDKEGFQLVNIGSGFDVSSFEDPAWVVENYYPFVCGFVKDFLSAKEVRVFEHQVMAHEAHKLPQFTQRYPSYVIANQVLATPNFALPSNTSLQYRLFIPVSTPSNIKDSL